MSQYSEKMTRELVEAYRENPTRETVQVFAEKFNLSPVSIRSKLVAEDVYVPQSKQDKDPSSKERKADIARDVEDLVLNLFEVEVKSFEYMKRPELYKLRSALQELRVTEEV